MRLNFKRVLNQIESLEQLDFSCYVSLIAECSALNQNSSWLLSKDVVIYWFLLFFVDLDDGQSVKRVSASESDHSPNNEISSDAVVPDVSKVSKNIFIILF